MMITEVLFHSASVICDFQVVTNRWSESSSARAASLALAITSGVIRRLNPTRSSRVHFAGRDHRIQERHGCRDDLPLPLDLLGVQPVRCERRLHGRDQPPVLLELAHDRVIQGHRAGAGLEDHVERQRDVGERLEDMIDRRGIWGLDTLAALLQDEVAPLGEDHRPSFRQRRFLGLPVCRAE